MANSRTRGAPGKGIEQTQMERAVAMFTEIVNSIPEADDDGSGILLGALMAEDWMDLNRPTGKLPSLEDITPAALLITRDITRHVSDIEGGLPFYLVCDAVNLTTGEPVRFQTSSKVPTIKIAKLYALDALPARVATSKAKTATRGGFHPLDLTVTEVRVGR